MCEQRVYGYVGIESDEVGSNLRQKSTWNVDAVDEVVEFMLVLSPRAACPFSQRLRFWLLLQVVCARRQNARRSKRARFLP